MNLVDFFLSLFIFCIMQYLWKRSAAKQGVAVGKHADERRLLVLLANGAGDQKEMEGCLGFRDTKREFERILGGCLDALEEVEATNSSPDGGKPLSGHVYWTWPYSLYYRIQEETLWMEITLKQSFDPYPGVQRLGSELYPQEA